MTSDRHLPGSCARFVDELARCGMRARLHVARARARRRSCCRSCASRGSRCVARRRALRRVLRARAGQGDAAVPVAVACTSGTAAANYAPGGDRGLRGAGAADRPHRRPAARAARRRRRADDRPDQALRRARSSGSSRSTTSPATPEPAALDPPARLPRATGRRSTGRPGPVHLNFPLREPLVLDEPLPAEEPGGGGAGRRPPVGDPAAPAGRAAPAALDGLADELGAAPRARDRRRPRRARARPGRCGRRASPTARGWPLLADPLSGARRGPAAVAHYDALLRDPAFGAARAPDLVLRVGDLPTSKPLRAVAGGARRAHRRSRSTPRAPGRTPTRGRDAASPPTRRGAVEALAGLPRAPRAAGWLERLARRRRAPPRGAIAAALGRRASEPRRGRRAGRLAACRDATLVRRRPRCRSATSRRSSPRATTPPRVLSNRGANGIDGTVSTAFGVAAAARGPGRAADRRRRAGPRHRRPAGRAPARPPADDRPRSTTTAAGSSTSCPSPRRATPSRSTSPRRTAWTSRGPPPLRPARTSGADLSRPRRADARSRPA